MPGAPVRLRTPFSSLPHPHVESCLIILDESSMSVLCVDPLLWLGILFYVDLSGAVGIKSLDGRSFLERCLPCLLLLPRDPTIHPMGPVVFAGAFSPWAAFGSTVGGVARRHLRDGERRIFTRPYAVSRTCQNGVGGRSRHQQPMSMSATAMG